MKIVYWNIFKVGSSKLKNKMNAANIAANGLGNNILDYISKVVLGKAVWASATSTVPADVFVIIEVVSGGTQKNADGTGSCLRVLNAVKAALNAAVGNKAYSYDFVKPKVIGYHEVVGIVYNTKTLTFVSSEAMRDSSNSFLLPRTPFWAKFTVKSTTDPLNIVGIHGPTSDPVSQQYGDAVKFTNALADVTQLNQSGLNPKQDTCIGGDFNCDPLNSYSSNANGKKAKVTAFQDLTTSYSYTITLPNGTLTSLKDAYDSSGVGLKKYMSQPYDNIVFQLPSQIANPPVKLADLVGQAITYGTSAVATFNAARAVSDHLPLTIEF